MKKVCAGSKVKVSSVDTVDILKGIAVGDTGEVMESDDFQKFEDDVKYALSKHDIHITGIEISPDEDGYVDHQSLDYYVSDGMYYIFTRDGITLEDYIFNKCYSLIIDNDNH